MASITFTVPTAQAATDHITTPTSGPRWLHCYQGDRGFHLATYQDGKRLLLTGMHFEVDGALAISPAGTRQYSGKSNPTLLDHGLALCEEARNA